MPKGVYKRTKEYREKMKKAMTGRKILWADEISKSLTGNPKLGGTETRYKKGHPQFNTGRTHFKKGHIPKSGFKKRHIPHNKGVKDLRRKIKKECLTCKKEFYVAKSKIDKKYCSRKCCSGINDPNWKGGYERTLWRNRQRRIKRKNAEGSHTLKEWNDLKEKCNYTCQACGKIEPEIKLTVDHIIPLSKKGTDYIDNIQPLCKSCNPSKGNKIKSRNNINKINKTK